MIETVTVEKVFWKDGDGANGKWHKIGILTKERGETWLGCFENKYNSKKLREIQEGQTITIVIEQNGDFYNFRFPTKQDVLEERVARIEKELWPNGVNADPNYPYPGKENDDGSTVPDPEDIPF